MNYFQSPETDAAKLREVDDSEGQQRVHAAFDARLGEGNRAWCHRHKPIVIRHFQHCRNAQFHVRNLTKASVKSGVR